MELALEHLEGKWKPVLLAHLKDGPLRYGELRRRVPNITDKMLTQRLRDLEACELVVRLENPVSRTVVYGLTLRGESLRPVLEALHTWGTRLAEETGATIGLPLEDT